MYGRMKAGNFEKAHVYEKAFSTMRKLKDKRDDKRVLTNLVFGENSAVPITCKADDITPIFLMKTLEEVLLLLLQRATRRILTYDMCDAK
jgi:hypothetical protein